jgi:hypothetical protein
MSFQRGTARIIAFGLAAMGIVGAGIAGTVVTLIFVAGFIAGRAPCAGQGGVAPWPWYKDHPSGVVMCNNGQIWGPRDALARCVRAGVCEP